MSRDTHSGIKYTHEEFVTKLSSMFSGEYIVLSNYINSKTKIKVRHICGYEYEVTPDNMLQGKGCRRCAFKIAAMKRTKTHGEFISEVYAQVGKEYTVLSIYEKANNRIMIRHNLCGHVYEVKPAHFVNLKRRCPKCAGKCITNEDFTHRLYHIHGDSLTVLDKYKNYNTKVRVICNICGHKYMTATSNLLKGSKCPKCADIRTSERCTKSNETFIKEVYDAVGDEYTVLSEYIGCKEDVHMRHNLCGHEFTTSSDYFINKKCRCPKCMESHGEQHIRNFLTSIDIEYIREKTFPDLKHKGRLRFDFYLPTLNLLIEYDGVQHFEPMQRKGMTYQQALNNFQANKLRDNMKNEYCKAKGITLIRFSYTQPKEEIENTIVNLVKGGDSYDV